MLTTCRACGATFYVGVRHVCEVRRAALPVQSHLALHPPPESETTLMTQGDTDLLHLKNLAIAALVPSNVREAWDMMADNVKAHEVTHGKRKEFYDLVRSKCDTLAKFIRLGAKQQHELIDMGWKSVIFAVPAKQKLKDMSEPPDGRLAKSFATSTLEAKALGKYGIAFRCDRRDASLVRQQGFTPLYHRDPPTSVRNTVVANGEMYMWLGNRDAIGETVVCVSRTLAGCTKFPFPTDQGDFHVYAVRPTGAGFDTEVWQTTFKEASVWRPGEKAMKTIPGTEVIGHVKVRKLGGGTDTEFYKYEFDNAARWTFYDTSPDEEQYLEGELALLRGGVRIVSKTDDFLVDTKDEKVRGKERVTAVQESVFQAACEKCGMSFPSTLMARLHQNACTG